MTKYLHTMIRVSDIDETLRFFDLLGLEEQRRVDVEAGGALGALERLGREGDAAKIHALWRYLGLRLRLRLRLRGPICL